MKSAALLQYIVPLVIPLTPSSPCQQTLPFMSSGTIQVPWVSIQMPQNPSIAQSNHKEALNWMIQAVDLCPVLRWQKMKFYKLGVCSSLNWPLTIHVLSQRSRTNFSSMLHTIFSPTMQICICGIIRTPTTTPCAMRITRTLSMSLTNAW